MISSSSKLCDFARNPSLTGQIHTLSVFKTLAGGLPPPCRPFWVPICMYYRLLYNLQIDFPSTVAALALLLCSGFFLCIWAIMYLTIRHHQFYKVIPTCLSSTNSEPKLLVNIGEGHENNPKHHDTSTQPYLFVLTEILRK